MVKDLEMAQTNLPDLETMTRKELVKLHRDIERTLLTLETIQKAKALSAAESAARELGYSLADIIGWGGKGAGKKAVTRPPKYRNPDAPEQTWSGRGRQPAWLQSALAEGRQKDDFLIAP